MNICRVPYRLIVCVAVFYSAAVAASQHADYSRRPLSEMLEVYSGFKANFQAGSNYNVGAAAALMANIGEKGGREVLPFLEEESLDPEMPKRTRSAAARAYIKIADVEEGFELMRKLYKNPSAQGSWRYFLNKKFLERVGAEENTLTPETRENIVTFLLGIVQNVEDSGEANDADRFLLDRIPEYANSRQRATLCRYANTGNEWVTNTYNPIKAHFDKIPPRQRIDLRKRFPDLPPLPDDAPARSPVKVAIAVAVGFVALAVCAVAAWLAARRRRVRETT